MDARVSTVELPQQQVDFIDGLIDAGRFGTRAEALAAALAELQSRITGERLAREASGLDRTEEVQMAEEGIEGDEAAWAEY